MELDLSFVKETLKQLMAIDSPSGFTASVMEKVEEISENLGYGFELTNKGCGIITVPGLDPEYVVGFCAHVDTLGLMVRSIKDNGALRFTQIGGPVLELTTQNSFASIPVTADAMMEPYILRNLPVMCIKRTKTSGRKKRWKSDWMRMFLPKKMFLIWVFRREIISASIPNW